MHELNSEEQLAYKKIPGMYLSWGGMIKFSETKLAHYSMLLIDIEREKPFSKKKKKYVKAIT